jgi:hypothetical protein
MKEPEKDADEETKKAYDEYLAEKAVYDKVKFFRIKGTDLDDERREVTDGMDLLTFLRGGNQDFMRI